MDSMYSIRYLSFRLLAVLSCIIAFGSHTAAAEQEDRSAIEGLVRSFVYDIKAGKKPDVYLAPNENFAAREVQLRKAAKRFQRFEIDFNKNDIVLVDPTHARLAAIAKWAAAGQEVEISRPLHFVKVSGQWFFEDFDFLEFHWGIVILMCAFGLAYAAAVLAFYFHWTRSEFPTSVSKYAWGAAIFTPAGWIFYPMLKPWRRQIVR